MLRLQTTGAILAGTLAVTGCADSQPQHEDSASGSSTGTDGTSSDTDAEGSSTSSTSSGDCAVAGCDVEPDTPMCGDNVLDPDEDCDDGNDFDGDGCNVDCRPSGQRRWEVRLDDMQRGLVAMDGSGDVFVVGRPNDRTHAIVTRLDSTGTAILRQTALSPIVGGTVRPTDIVVTADGTVHISTTELSGEMTDVRLHRVSSQGEAEPPVWLGPATTRVVSGLKLAVLESGSVVAGGCALVGSDTEQSAWLQSTSTDDDPGWMQQGPGCVVDIAALEDEIIVYAAASSGRELQRWSGSGEFVQTTPIQCDGMLSVSSSGTALVTCMGAGPCDQLCAVGPDGSPQLSPFATELGNNERIAVAPDGSLLAVNLGLRSVLIQKFLADGTTGWIDEHDSFDLAETRDIAIGPDGDIVVVGDFYDAPGGPHMFVLSWTP